MKGRVIVLQHRPAHAALVVDGRVEDLLLDVDNPTRPPQPGEIWTAQVIRSTQGAVFVDLGNGHTGFLRDTRGIKGSKLFLVQISSIPEPGKAIPVDRRLLVKGRTLILTPNAAGINVSRQIKDPDERERLTTAIKDLPQDAGVIIRSAARDMPSDVLQAELSAIIDAQIHLTNPKLGVGPMGQATSPRIMALREWSMPLPDLIAATTDLAAELRLPQDVFHDPDLADCLEPGDGDPFDHFGVWDEIERLKSPRADLPSGGWMAIETTRAMVTVDINTGDGFGGGDAMTTNIEAARELPRQLRLRGLGGQVIIDFAPLKKQHRKKIEETLKSAFRRDPIDTSLAGWTPLGNFELQRKRERTPLTELL
ncbi:MAG: ribonuclease E/G [Paracoccaceae bacterium]